MIAKGKAAVDVATIGSGKEEQIREAAIDLPDKEYITTPERKQGRIEALLPRGEANAISARQLIPIVGAASARDLRLMVERERRNGALILSSVRGHGGYYLPSEGEAGRTELRAFDRTTTARIASLARMIRHVRQALKTIDGQQTMEGIQYGEEQSRSPDMV